MDECYIVFIFTKDLDRATENLRPMEVMFDKNNLSLSGLISMTNQAYVHYTAMMNTIEPGDENIRFEM